MDVDAFELAAMVRRGEVSPEEVRAQALDAMRNADQRLNFVVTDLGDDRSLGRKPSVGRLLGVPFMRKDLGVAVAGEPLYLGNAALRRIDFRPNWTSELAHRFEGLGLQTIGTTNTPEMGAQTTTQPLSTGPTRNPWDPTLSVSGSSGGSAAAVAAGVVPIAHANDYLGSTRLPAAWNGLIGLKPSRGRVPLGPSAVSRMSSECVLTRSVRDLAIVLEGIAGPAPGELWVAPECPEPFSRAVARGAAGALEPLRVGLLIEHPAGGKIDQAVVDAVLLAGALLEEAGHKVTIDSPAALSEPDDARPQPNRPSDYRRRLRVISSLLGRPVREEDVEPFLWAMAQPEGEDVDAHLAAEVAQQEWSARVTTWWERDGFDILITPTIAMGPESLVSLTVEPKRPAAWCNDHKVRHIAFTGPFNVTGQPALAMPVGDPLPGSPAPAGGGGWLPPSSVQLIGPPYRDDLVLAVAAQLEATGRAGWPHGGIPEVRVTAFHPSSRATASDL